MKRVFTSAVALLISIYSFGSGNKDGRSNNELVIDSQDSVVFDLSQASINGNIVSFPIYIHSNDTVNSLDFSAKFNQNNFQYDSIIRVASYLQGVSYFNMSDSTIRFTSYSLQPIETDTVLVQMSFRILSGQFCASDLNSISVLLNGDPCTSKVTDCVNTAVNEVGGQGNSLVYPNPTTSKLILSSSRADSFQLIDLERRIVASGMLSNERSIELNVESFSRGYYLIRFLGSKYTEVKRVVLN